MLKEKTLFIAGILVMTIPNLGFSSLTEKIIFIIIGFLIIFVAYGFHFAKEKRNIEAKTEARQPKVSNHSEPKFKEETTGFTYINPPSHKASDGQGKDS